MGNRDRRAACSGRAGQPVIAGIAIRCPAGDCVQSPRGELQDAVEALQYLFGMGAGAPGMIGEDDPGRVIAAPSTIVPGQRPEIAGLGPAAAGIQHRRGGLVYYPAGASEGCCREGMNSLDDAFRCSASRSTTGPRWSSEGTVVPVARRKPRRTRCRPGLRPFIPSNCPLDSLIPAGPVFTPVGERAAIDGNARAGQDLALAV